MVLVMVMALTTLVFVVVEWSLNKQVKIFHVFIDEEISHPVSGINLGTVKFIFVSILLFIRVAQIFFCLLYIHLIYNLFLV